MGVRPVFPLTLAGADAMDELVEHKFSTEDPPKFAEPQPCWDDIGGPRLSPEQTRALLAKQVQLCGQQLRGNMSDVHKWIAGGDLCPCVAASSRAVGLFVAEEVLIRRGTACVGDTFEPFTNRYGDVLELQADDYLFDESRWARVAGSCFLVAPDIVMTAAHVIGDTARKLLAKRELLVVFDFQSGASAAPPVVMSKNRSVFTVLGIVKQGENRDPGSDWISLRLDRPVTESTNRPFLRVARHELDLSREVYCLGHPKAIALRYCRSREVWDGGVPNCLEAHLDAYDGISGSPVFDSVAHMVVGMMIRSCPTPAGQVLTYQDRHLSPLCHRDDRRCGSIIISSRQFASGF